MSFFNPTIEVVKKYGDVTMLTEDGVFFKVKVNFPLSQGQLDNVSSVFDGFESKCLTSEHVCKIGTTNITQALILTKDDAEQLFNQLSAILPTMENELQNEMFYSM